MQWYARQVANNPCSVILLVLAAALGCAVICITLNDLPSFKDPLLGFEPRGTPLSQRETAWQNLLKSTSWNGPLTFYPGSIVTDITNETLEAAEWQKTSQNERNGTNETENGDGPWLQLETEEVSYGRTIYDEVNSSGRIVLRPGPLKPSKILVVEERNFFCNNPTRNYAHVIIQSVSGGNLFTVEGLKSICEIDENKLRKSKFFPELCEHTQWNTCCRSWSISNYVALLQNLSSCHDIKQSDVTAVLQLLLSCAPYYHGMKLSHDCTMDPALCRGVPRPCFEYDAVYNILHYLTDVNFLNPNSPSFNVPKLTYTAVFLPTAQSSAALSYYKDLENIKLCNDVVEVVGMELGLKYKLFVDCLLHDTLYVAMAGILIFVLLWMYSSSFFVTFMTICSVAFSVGMAYFMYTVIYQIEFFPFINLLTIIIIIGIGADDACIYCKIWACAKAEKNNGTLVKLVRDTLHHACLSMFITSVTTAVAFFGSVISNITAVRCFRLEFTMSKRKLTLEEIEAAAMRCYDSWDDEDFDLFDSDADPAYFPERSSDETDMDDDIDNVIEDVIQAVVSDEEFEDLTDLPDSYDQENNIITTDGWTEYVGRQKVFEFIGKHGLQSDISQQSTPLDIFLLLVDEEIINHIVVETNRYAGQIISSQPKLKHSRINRWNETNHEEMKKFLGLMMWMGLVPLGRLEDYWSQNGVYNMTIPRAIMSRIRFQILLTMLHFDNNETSDTSNRLRKIQHLVDMLQQKFKALFYPGEDFVIDETLVPWRGRLIFRQYIPNKSHRYGVKLFKLCSVDGYTWGLKVYTGKYASGERETGLAKSMCLELAELLLNQGRTLYIDNFYTSYDLAKCLLDKKTHVVGTLRANKRDIPKEVLQANLKKGEMISREDENGIVVLKCKDTRDVRILSTKHAPIFVPVAPRKKRALQMEQGKNTNQHAATTSTSQSLLQSMPSTSANQFAVIPSTNLLSEQPSTSTKTNRQYRRALEKPEAILAYNKGKAGIDLSDQMGAYATTLRKGVKWYRKLGLELLLGVAVVNAWVVYRHVTKSKMKIRKFRERLVFQLLGMAIDPDRNEQTSKKTHHLIDRIHENGKKVRRKCHICYINISKTEVREQARKKAKLISTYCDNCPDQPQMCRNCFNAKH